MTDFERNSPLGIVTEGLLQKQDPIAAAAGGVIKKKKYNYVAKIDAFVGGSSLLELTFVPTIISSVSVGPSSPIEVTFNPPSVIEPLAPQPLAITAFIPSTQEERGGRGAYTKRKQVVQPHHYVWDVPLKLTDAINVEALAETSFIKHQKYLIITSLPAVKLDPITFNYEPEIVEKPKSFSHDALVTFNVGGSSSVKHVDRRKVLRRQEEQLLSYMLAVEAEPDMVVSTFYDYAGDKRRKRDDDLLRALDVI